MGLRPGGRVGARLRPALTEIDADRGVVTRVRSVNVQGPDGFDQELTSAAPGPDGTLWQAAHTEVLHIDTDTLDVVDRWSHPWLHNVHSVTPRPGGGTVVTATSTDRLLWFDRSNRLEHVTALAPRSLPEGDLRPLDHGVFKPHHVHPNHACFVGDALWVTRFATRDCRPVGNDHGIDLPEAMPHDGRLRGGWLWFTQVTGRIVAVDPETRQRTVDLDLAALTGEPRMLGWCRGLDVVGDRLFVGFTMLRRPRHREVLRLLWRGLRGVKLPTRVIELDWRQRRVVRQVVVGNAAGGTIYAVTALPPS